MPTLISSDKIKVRHWWSRRYKYGGEFGRSICEMYPKERELKVEHPGDHAMFLSLEITKKEGTFIYMLFDKRNHRKQYPSKYFFFSNQRWVFKNCPFISMLQELYT